MSAGRPSSHARLICSRASITVAVFEGASNVLSYLSGQALGLFDELLRLPQADAGGLAVGLDRLDLVAATNGLDDATRQGGKGIITETRVPEQDVELCLDPRKHRHALPQAMQLG